MRLLVAGSRDCEDVDLIYETLDRVDRQREITCIIEGEGGREVRKTVNGNTWVTYFGADLLAKCWAQGRGKDVAPFPADWDRYGRAAGPLRNQRMIDEGKPDGALIFPGGRGTQDMRRKLEAAGITRFEPIPLVGLDQEEARAK